MITYKPTENFPSDPKEIAEFLRTKNEFLAYELTSIVRFDPDKGAMLALHAMGLLDDKGRPTEKGRAVVRELDKRR